MWSVVPAPGAAQVRDAFGVAVGELRPHPGGFEADAFTDGRWFVKLWRQQPDSDAALALTAELAARGIPVPAAQQTLDGSYTSMCLGRRYALFPFADGRQATWDDADAIAQAMCAVHEIADLLLPRTDMDEWCIATLRDRRDHPWIADRRDEVMANVDRLEAVIERARAIDVTHVVCHRDLFPQNVLVDHDGHVVALLDWGLTMLAPREHDVFAGLCGPDPARFLRAYSAQGLDLTHLEYARLARSLRDIAVRIDNEVDLDGINTWGFDRLRRVDADLALARPFCDR
ncbi:Ser/Thr protein kinase RdoA (MazF antagonist) [Asanoa ferruginea]|uniref:Ser/Thr protein kinase RdoA (MazF antagonist) n=1 Tax=Asanoa ferruginea TaxID=53367 RepID=A0A3D9ZVB9_9ACTN|nr:aminoglycoside phosphotransferase family protein [Asanoa ferruginea]REG01138.1 Ser/Thr protein kinase RdoA (MazF antagonist) [Asanoa ferruginea]